MHCSIFFRCIYIYIVIFIFAVKNKNLYFIHLDHFSHSGHCIGQPSKISILIGMHKNSNERRAYESVDDESRS